MTSPSAEHRHRDRDGTAPRILVLATEGWFVVSHFLPLLRVLGGLGADVTVATRVGREGGAMAAAGARTADFDFPRGLQRPDRDAVTVARLVGLLRREQPDVVHAIALKPIVLAGLASFTAPGRGLVLHLTGSGYAGTSRAAAPVLGAAQRLISRVLRRPNTRLIVENPEDAERLRHHGPLDERRVALVGGAGVDPARFAPGPEVDPTRAGFVGRMIWSKGVDVLMAAHEELRRRGIAIEISLAGSPDPANPRAIPCETLRGWAALPRVHWHPRVEDVAGFWRQRGIAVIPSRGGEGLPRALLEAAACARAIVTTDVPGCRHFVRQNVEGLIVPPDNAPALADALARLAGDAQLARRLGAAARERVLQGFTEAHVEAAVAQVYRDLLPGRFN